MKFTLLRSCPNESTTRLPAKPQWRVRTVLATLFITMPAITLPAMAAAQDPSDIHDLVVVVIDSVEVAATETGVIAQLPVREGDSVKKGQVLGNLDDRRARLEKKLALTQLEIATAHATDGLGAELAEKKLEHQKQLAKQHEVVREIADRKAENEVRVLASKKAEGVTKNELDRANQARREFIDSVSQSEIDGLQLAFDRSKLETQQADFERGLDRLNVKSEMEAATAHILNIDRSKIELAQAVLDRKVQLLQKMFQEHQSELAALVVERHQLISPLDGHVVERMHGEGDWVKTGDAILRVVRLDRLRAEGFADAKMIDTLRANRNVTLTATDAPSAAITRPGTIVFISPEIDPVNNEVRFWVEFDNAKMDILPGMRVQLEWAKK